MQNYEAKEVKYTFTTKLPSNNLVNNNSSSAEEYQTMDDSPSDTKVSDLVMPTESSTNTKVGLVQQAFS